jgi:NAD(P)-dependent dehydrogenase (short-subunit alcohol dehydrogenase family)
MTGPLDFDRRVVLVAGASRGIGFACAEAFAARGATVAMADIARNRLEEAHSSLTAESETRHTRHVVDLADVGASAQLVADVVDRHGRLDVLVNAAGVLTPRSFLDLTQDDWDRTLGVNARGAVFLAQAAARHMVERGAGGRIVLVASIVARHRVRPNNTAYSASKSAVLQAASCMALELAPHDVTVNVVSPGSTATEMLLEDQLGGDAAGRERAIHGDLAGWRLGVPLGRLAEPADQAAAVLFLASDEAGHITGQELAVDGGQTVV